MMTFLAITFLILSVGFNIIFFILIKRTLSKIDIYERWILEFKSELEMTVLNMRTIDKQGTFATSLNSEGTFESDDQVGQIFKELLSLIEKLNDRIQ